MYRVLENIVTLSKMLTARTLLLSCCAPLNCKSFAQAGTELIVNLLGSNEFDQSKKRRKIFTSQTNCNKNNIPLTLFCAPISENIAFAVVVFPQFCCPTAWQISWSPELIWMVNLI